MRPRVVAWVLATSVGCATSGGVAAATSVNAVVGATYDGPSARIGLIEGRAATSRHWTIAPAVAYLEGTAGYHELQARLAAIGTFDRGPWTIDNRHMLSVSTESIQRYRARLRIARRGLLGLRALSARTFDELYFDFDRGRVIRNNVAAGLGLALNDAVTAEFYHVWVDNRGARDDSYVLALVSVRLGTRH